MPRVSHRDWCADSIGGVAKDGPVRHVNHAGRDPLTRFLSEYSIIMPMNISYVP
jgi:hypothetical protein